MNLRLLYIAAPYSAPTMKGVGNNICFAWDVAVDVITQCPGFFPVVPQASTAHMENCAPVEYFYEGTAELLRRCDAVLMAGNWKESKGCVNERCMAMILKMPIYYAIEEVKNAAKKEEGGDDAQG